MLEELKEIVCNANIDLIRNNLVINTWGNVSGIDRKKGLVIIKPSGLSFDKLKPEDMVIVKLETGEVVEGKWRPSSDTPTHLELYRNFLEIGGITHTHSINAVAFAQAGIDIPILGTTQADYFSGAIPCTRELLEEEVIGDYELNTGSVIVKTIKERKINPLSIPGIVIKNHGPFTWGENINKSVENAIVLECVAEMNFKTLLLNPNATIKKYILNKHYSRKHGPGAYYGQK